MTGIIVRCEESDFIFRPQEDITAFELSQALAYFILPALAVKSVIFNSRKWSELPDNVKNHATKSALFNSRKWVDLPENVKKHFFEQKREGKKEEGFTENILEFLTFKGD